MTFRKTSNEISLPQAMLPPQTYGDLYIMDTLIDQQFPFAREAALRGNSGDRIREIQMALKEAFWSQCAPSEPLSEKTQNLASKMLDFMFILDSDESNREELPIATQELETKAPDITDIVDSGVSDVVKPSLWNTIMDKARKVIHLGSKNIPSL